MTATLQETDRNMSVCVCVFCGSAEAVSVDAVRMNYMHCSGTADLRSALPPLALISCAL